MFVTRKALPRRTFLRGMGTTLALHRAGEWVSGLGVIQNTFNVLVNAAVVVAKKLGTGFVVACLVAVGTGYAMCIGAGTVYFRLAFAKR